MKWTREERNARPSLTSPSILAPAPEKKYGLRRRLHLQIRIRDPASRYVIEAFGNWSSHNPSADLCGLRATGGWGFGYIHTCIQSDSRHHSVHDHDLR